MYHALLIDIGNTHTHVGLAYDGGLIDTINLPTQAWTNGSMTFLLKGFCKDNRIESVAFCSVVPSASELARFLLEKEYKKTPFELNHHNICEIGIDYPSPNTIGADRLANTIALSHYYGSPAVAIDFGTAVTFDIIHNNNYIGGIIAPGLATMTTYLHEKTAQLPCIEIREIETVIGKTTADAMRIGAVHGYRGLIKELIAEIKNELKVTHLPVIATGGYAQLISEKIMDIQHIDSDLTLKGLLLALNHQNTSKKD